MILDPLFFAMAVPAVLFAGISKGGFGSGAAFAAAPFLAIVIDPATAVALMLPLLMIMDGTALRVWWRRWDRAVSRVLILGSLPGIALGAVAFTMVNADVLRFMIGTVALAFVAFQLARGAGMLRPAARPPGPAAGLFWGGVSGFTSFISHAGGPPAAVYMLSKQMTKASYQATTVLVFAWVNLLKFAIYVWLGLFGQSTVLAVGALAPFAVLGVWLGAWAHGKVPERPFFLLVHGFLAVTGAKLIWDAVA